MAQEPPERFQWGAPEVGVALLAVLFAVSTLVLLFKGP